MWNRLQLSWLIMPSAFLAFMLAAAFLLNPSYTKRLFTNPQGVKMAVGAAVLFVAGTIAYLAVCAWINNYYPAEDERRGRINRFLSNLFGTIYLLVSYLPAVFTIWVGPAALRISEQMTK